MWISSNCAVSGGAEDIKKFRHSNICFLFILPQETESMLMKSCYPLWFPSSNSPTLSEIIRSGSIIGCTQGLITSSKSMTLSLASVQCAMVCSTQSFVASSAFLVVLVEHLSVLFCSLLRPDKTRISICMEPF